MIFLWIGFIVLFLVAVYLYAIMPRMIKRPDRTPFEGKLYAHRGLFDNETDAPENSLPAFAKAAENGFGIEMDIQLTKDKIPVVFHDFTLRRACRTSGKVIDYTYEELKNLELFRSQEHIPTLEEALEVIGGRVPIIVELKIEWRDYRVCRIADEILRKYKGAYAIESFNPLALLWYRKNHKEVVRGQLADHFRKEGTANVPFYFLLHYLTLNFLTKPDFIAYNHKYSKNMSRQICRYLFGAAAAGWTIKNEEQLKAAKENFDWFIFDGFIPKERSAGLK
ncbi:MAG: glycerophosphodiester phosphodiesterase [Lachnospiraceae bacterium]|nr:glycerophosphodiester phosphodiesterase [Lachnospiraceae bacterium]